MSTKVPETLLAASDHLLASLPSSRGLQTRRTEKLPSSPSGNLPAHYYKTPHGAGSHAYGLDNGGNKPGAHETKDLLKDLKELKIRSGASRNVLFTKTDHQRNKQQELKNRAVEERLDDDKGMSTKTKSTTKATTELNSNQDTKLNANPEPEKKKVGPCAAPIEVYSPFSPRNHLCKIGSQKTNRMLFQALNCSAKDCMMCSRAKTLGQILRESLNKKYLPSRDTYNAKVITDIVYNENTHIVVAFKDYLIYDDVSEFLKRFYGQHESGQRLGKVLDYYKKYSKVFPNYAVIQENKYMFRNIEWKQRAIDERYKGLHEMKKKRGEEEDKDVDNKIFTTCFLHDLNKTDSILGRSAAGAPGDDSFNESSWFKKSTETQMQSYIKSQESIRNNGHYEKPSRIECTMNHYEDLNLQELVDKFILKDSQSLIQQNAEDEAKKPGQCAVQVKNKTGENKHKVLEIAIGSKKVLLKHEPVWDKIKEKVKHARTKSHNNLSTQQNINASLKCLEAKDVFPLSCKHEALPPPAAEAVTSRNARHQASSRQQVTEAWTSTQKSTKKEKVKDPHLMSCEEIQEDVGMSQKSLIKVVSTKHVAGANVRSKSHGKFCTDPHRRAAAASGPGLRKQESARATPTAKFECRGKSNERGGRRADSKTARGAYVPANKEIAIIKSPKSGRETKKASAEPKKQPEHKTKIKMALQIPSTARASSAAKSDVPTVATARHMQINTNLMLSLGIKSPTATATTATHFRAATAMSLPKNESKSTGKPKAAQMLDAEVPNWQKQEMGFDTKTFTSGNTMTCSKAGARTGEYCSNRTPDPSHRRFKSSYLNTLNAKVQMQLEENRRVTAEPPASEQKEEQAVVVAMTQPHARPGEGSLTASKSLGNLRKQAKGARRHAESIHETVEKKTSAAVGEKKKKEVKKAGCASGNVKWRPGSKGKDLQI